MFGGAKKWVDRKVASKNCRSCLMSFRPSCGGNLYCHDCALTTRRKNQTLAQARLRSKNPEKYAEQKASHDLKKFGLSLADYDLALELQQGKCAICRTLPIGGRGRRRKLAVDHCHATGKVRALLCSACNTALGLLREDETIVRSMLNYLKDHK